MEIFSVNSSNLQILANLAQAYEAEFSAITKKKPNEDGSFLLDTQVDEFHPGFILFIDLLPIGFCIKGMYENTHDISEFYIVPSFRSNSLGQDFAIEIFKKYPGTWQVRQIEGAGKATKFWRKVIKKYTNGNYVEIICDDPYWGKVTKQTFQSNSIPKN